MKTDGNSKSGGPRRFFSDYSYNDRKSKSMYVWQKYKEILTDGVLDVGADEMHLREHLPEGSEYVGVGLGDGPSINLNLETEPLPFEDNSFNCGLCLDVLEHVENAPAVFDELCRVSSRYVIVALPNGWASLYNVLRFGSYSPESMLKFHGMPAEAPEDRHKWFFNITEAREFVDARADENQMSILQSDEEGVAREGRGPRGMLRRLGRMLLFDKRIARSDLYSGALWMVLQKPQR